MQNVPQCYTTFAATTQCRRSRQVREVSCQLAMLTCREQLCIAASAQRRQRTSLLSNLEVILVIESAMAANMSLAQHSKLHGRQRPCGFRSVAPLRPQARHHSANGQTKQHTALAVRPMPSRRVGHQLCVAALNDDDLLRQYSAPRQQGTQLEQSKSRCGMQQLFRLTRCVMRC
jgi:hypothetical protein